MAEDKKGFLLYADLIHTIEKMPSEKAGDLFKHILRYVNDLKPVSNDLIIDLTFEPIKQQLKRDLIKFEKSKDEKSLSGRVGNLKRWNIDLYNKFISKELTIEEAENIVISRKVSQPDKVQSQPIANIAVNDNVNVNVNDNVIKDINTFDFKKSCIDFGFKSELVVDWLKVRKNKKLTNTETAFNKFINQIKLNGQDKDLILEKCIEKSWGGFESDWFKSQSIINKIDNPHGLSPALLESDRLARIAIEEAIKQKAIDKELDRLDELRRKQQNS